MSATTHTADHTDSAHHIGPSFYLVVYGALMGLMALTLGMAFVDLGAANFAIAMGIAAVKMVLVLLYFMHVRYSDKLTWVFSTAAFLWFLILVTLTLSDFFTRGFFDVPGK